MDAPELTIERGEDRYDTKVELDFEVIDVERKVGVSEGVLDPDRAVLLLSRLTIGTVGAWRVGAGRVMMVGLLGAQYE